MAEEDPLGMEIDVMAEPPEVAANECVPLELEARLTVSAVVVRLPKASCSWTVMGPMVDPDPAEPEAEVEVKANRNGVAAVMLNAFVVTVVSPVPERASV